MYLLNRTNDKIDIQSFHYSSIENFIDSNRPNHGEINDKIDGIDMDADLDIDHEEIDPDEHFHRKEDLRRKYARLIRIFAKYNRILTKDEVSKLKQDANAIKVHANEVMKKQASAYLEKMDNRIYHHDLESTLHVMLRLEMANHPEGDIKNDEFKVLQNWINILAKYYPGRKSVKNFLKSIQKDLGNYENEISIVEWGKLINNNKPLSFLPYSIEWRHCAGSSDVYRGYPCGLWTLFHALTVSQVETEKINKHKPFEQLHEELYGHRDGVKMSGNSESNEKQVNEKDMLKFDVTEVIIGVKEYVATFFGCSECAENFEEETKFYKRELIKPHDAIEYLWKVHNKVNKRLSKNTETQDPMHPKVLFPTLKQCPKCYLTGQNGLGQLQDHESHWVLNEAILFVASFYSRFQIEGENDSNRTFTSQIEKQNQFELNKSGELVRNEKAASNQSEEKNDSQNDKKEEEEKEEEKENVNSRDDQEINEKNFAKVDQIVSDDDSSNSYQPFLSRNSVLGSEFVLISLLITIVGLYLLYTGFISKRSKLKRHIV
jgi:hypothetical protein